ncbi:MAG TPA: type II secretion system F family protein [Planctomycetota bacterium]|nr:type II secretion system F family protein [Planctomycetota bacterium]
MPIYAYRARTTSGQLAEGTIEVTSETELARRLDSQGLLLTTAAPVKARSRSRRGSMRIRKKDLVAFTYNLETVYSAGIPVVQGLEDLADSAGGSMARVARTLADEIRGGAGLAEAMARFPGIFPRVYTSVVQAGESAGEAGPILRRLADYNQWLLETRANVLRALMYPVILLTAVGGLVLLLLTFLVPRMLKVLTRARVELPLPTKILMAISNFLSGNILIIGLAVVGIAVGFLVFRRSAGGRMLIDSAKLRLPLVGTLLRKVCAARFANTFSTLYRAGIGTVESLEIAEQVVGNARVAAALRDARERVVQGETLSAAIRRSGTFPPLVVRMIGLGEQTGTLGDSLDRTAAFYDREIPQTIKTVLSLLEPAMIMLAGAAVAFILLCTFLPIFKMAGAIHR